jgi:hypothetical protein
MENGWLVLIVDYAKGEYAILDLFDQEGRYIANFKATVPVEGLFFNNGKAYAIATEEGYKFVIKFLHTATGLELMPGVVTVIQTFGDRINFHPHIH